MKSNRKPRVGPLDTVQAVRRELGRVYRLARYGDLETDTLRAFVYTLNTLIGMGATVYLGVCIGEDVQINNGANVFKDVRDGTVVKA